MSLNPYKLLTPEERARINRALKRGPKFGDRARLAQYTKTLYAGVTGRDLPPTAEKRAQ
jgi:hypothetical protein